MKERISSFLETLELKNTGQDIQAGINPTLLEDLNIEALKELRNKIDILLSEGQEGLSFNEKELGNLLKLHNGDNDRHISSKIEQLITAMNQRNITNGDIFSEVSERPGNIRGRYQTVTLSSRNRSTYEDGSLVTGRNILSKNQQQIVSILSRSNPILAEQLASYDKSQFEKLINETAELAQVFKERDVFTEWTNTTDRLINQSTDGPEQMSEQANSIGHRLIEQLLFNHESLSNEDQSMSGMTDKTRNTNQLSDVERLAQILSRIENLKGNSVDHQIHVRNTHDSNSYQARLTQLQLMMKSSSDDNKQGVNRSERNLIPGIMGSKTSDESNQLTSGRVGNGFERSNTAEDNLLKQLTNINNLSSDQAEENGNLRSTLSNIVNSMMTGSKRSSENMINLDNSSGRNPFTFDRTDISPGLNETERSKISRNQQQVNNPFANLTTLKTGSEAANRVHDNQNPVNQGDVYSQVEKGLESFQRIGKNSIEMQLEPESLGKVKLNIAVEDGQVSVQFKVDNTFVKNELEQNIHLLKNNFIRQGYNVDHIQVETDNHDAAFQQQDGSANQNFNQQSNQQGRQNPEFEGMTVEEIYNMFLQEEEEGIDVFSYYRKMRYSNAQSLNYFA
ncbi:MAG: flagellar hook-length control protein FliK [Halanaerobiales bacterium]